MPYLGVYNKLSLYTKVVGNEFVRFCLREGLHIMAKMLFCMTAWVSILT